ncbi:SPOR domain-containing protein [Sphingorhabdus pulchriflava]|uniref:SPOR domain-containing protein n=1 Tax=Sphingorhabdus pulchriflava TaxID=2292257 RepID=A0A371BFY7_9SPHN|nr:SPOR domain-containing protein [Sphingorhabdus pulchriflava]RDV06509.1 SPOR domain-containing protein [Sphingorhabdus pulchriflava]
MTDDNRDEDLGLDDPDRLPWLETADGYEYEESASPLKVAGLVLGGLALLAAIVGGIYWLQRSQSDGASGNGELIAAQEGDYKVAPADREGKSFEGEGDSAFAASEGKKVGATIDPAKAKAVEAAPASPGAAPAKTGPAPAGSGFVQLGAFSDAAAADQAWAAMGKRFGFLSGLNRRIAEGASEGGRKVYRLQAVTANPAAAQQLCAKLKAAGENCMVVK